MIYPRVYVAALLGLGDAIVFKPLMKILSQQHEQMYWPCLKENLPSVKALFADCANIHILQFEGDAWEKDWCAREQIAVLNFRQIIQETEIRYAQDDLMCKAAVQWDRQIYDYFDVRMSVRYTQWQAQFDPEQGAKLYTQLNPDQEPYLLWHNGMSYRPQGAPVDLIHWRAQQGLPPLKVIPVQPHTHNLLDWHVLIEQAQEIHCVASSFFHLVDSLWNRTQADLYYHEVRSNAILQVNCHANNYRWRVVNYPFRV